MSASIVVAAASLTPPCPGSQSAFVDFSLCKRILSQFTTALNSTKRQKSNLSFSLMAKYGGPCDPVGNETQLNGLDRSSIPVCSSNEKIASLRKYDCFKRVERLPNQRYQTFNF